ncbi:Flp pilus assembly protein CpaB [Sedimentitalea sp. JM2-8]|uniref:Flp pilus assembly protein CpaB n=1 Tax=Sedimentitalea xiamensis TaxID=3050037 RepID=A0ABT7FBS3_9RHOB|nr:Flp pilus assembly protein CpaB [Sedimentitalea xiamensis]MDK3072566.1 Flp pilus assembly protein CpaB [Sedimentitalea xiamensis]
MRFSALITALTGLAVAGGSVYVARDYIRIDKGPAQATAESETVGVIVASRDIVFGEAIEPNMLTTIDWPRASLPAGVYTGYKTLLGDGNQPPRRARRAISQGELILHAKVSDFGEKVTIVQTIGAKNRAMAIEVDAETAVGGFVTPGDRVDIVLTQGRSEGLSAITILQNIRVIGVDQEADEQTDQPSVARTVTVEVTPDEGQRLALAQRAGRLSLTLRSIEDTENRSLEMTRLNDLLREPEPEVAEEAPRKSVIRVRRGTDLTETVIN